MADAKQGKAPLEDFYNGPSQSRVVLAKPKLGGFGASSFGSSSSIGTNPFGSVLRPAQLKATSNPFVKPADVNDDSKSENAEKTQEDRLKDTNEDVPKFVPLGSTNVSRSSNTVPAPKPVASSSGFVFGQNLSARVVMVESVNNGEAKSVDHSATNGTSELLFSSAAASIKDSNQDEAGPSESRSATEGLAAAAAEYERSHARPAPLPTNNITTTGEEGEINVIQISCRLFAWEAGSWRERGRGLLRLNDAAGGGGARLVVRVAGSLRVALNTKVWPDMVAQLAGAKSLRITAADAHNHIRVFLIMGTTNDIVQLYRSLTVRIASSKRSINDSTLCSQNASSQTAAAERLEADTEDYEYNEAGEDNSSELKEEESLVDDVHGDDETDAIDRLEADTVTETEECSSTQDSEDKEIKSLKRKEPTEDETSSKRQCPDIVIQ